ncbi:malate synthase A [Sanguibacter sp. HDW7]|uniref:malate synthase A n=1 Tax=Sanguibacter sp. HDW7 TaxID=2714931 RepID=UPI00140A5D5F|nr:malate synthase A [Sanguibacter sp. HDW7]QIK82788.1 malate synthase A [Sanguibacter sp. HDW7]
MTLTTDSPTSPPRTRPTIRPTRDAGPRGEEILTPDALDFVAELHDRFAARRHDLLVERQRARQMIEDGIDPDFLPETRHVREDRTWRVAGPGPGLERRHVEITGPTDPKMAINALGSGADVWLADHEDALSPTWENVVGGQVSLHDGIRGTLEHTSPEGKEYRLPSSTLTDLPTIVFRPRGWHLIEKHLRSVDRAGTETPASASLVDAGLYLFHNARELVARGRGPYLYLPKLEGRREARLWDEVFSYSEERLGLPHGTIRATVLIETLPAAFEMEEVLYELRDHCAGLNAGRWDYLFSMIKNFRRRGSFFVLPDRGAVTMTVPFMRAYTELLVATCHQRGAQAIGGMSAFIPDRRRPEVTERAEAQVRADKRREATDGFDGTWVAHPDLIPYAREEFDAVLEGRDDQRDRLREDAHVTARDLLDVSSASAGAGVSAEGLRANISVGVRYIASWLRGTGAAAIDHLMEDAATAEISRSQVWQWIHNGTRTVGGAPVTVERVEALLAQIVEDLPRTPGDRIEEAAQIFRDVACGDDFPTFLTIGAYARLD